MKMAVHHHILMCLQVIIVLLAAGTGAVKPRPYTIPFNRTSFPAGFLFGAGEAAYQAEGAANKDGRAPSTWDTFVKEHPEKVADASTGDVADDFYHLYKDDIQLMKTIGLNSFRFSISWSRLLPTGKVSGGVNPLGVKFYNNLINELLANGLQPFVTLCHWDLPQALQDEYGGWLSPKIVKDFRDYADFCFKTFGDRVKLWVTFNEPNAITIFSYNDGSMSPARCSKYVNNCTDGNSATEPYIAAHHYLLSHASAVQLYRAKYQTIQKGEIGITIVTDWYLPKSKTIASKNAASRSIDFLFGWFAHPITYGDYPKSMRRLVGSRLPKFTEAELKMVKGSMDFLGLNYYTAKYAENAPLSSSVNQSFYADSRSILSMEKNGKHIGTPTVLPWLYIYPKGIQELLLYIKNNYNDPPIYINENGVPDNASLPLKDGLKDGNRIRYLRRHLSYILKSIKEGVKVKGYYVWSFLDQFEGSAGYTVRFGITYVDFNNNLKRYLKNSAYWFKKFLLN